MAVQIERTIMQKKQIPKVGQTLYSLNVGNASRRIPQVLTEVIVERVGRKYFTTRRPDGHIETSFRLEDWEENAGGYAPNAKLYESPQQWEDEKEEKQICREIRDAFEFGGNQRALQLHHLRAIKAIIDHG